MLVEINEADTGITNSCKIIMVTSCKGGVGKSTVAANLGIRLAYDGYKTLILDCDFGVRSLDLIMGLEDNVIYDISDIILRDVDPEKVIVSDERSENLFFCAAPYSNVEHIEKDQFKDAIEKINLKMSFDYIIIDTPGDIGLPFELATSVSDIALVISTYQPASLRAAERTGIMLTEKGVEERKLIINCFEKKAAENDDTPGLLDIIDRTCIQLIGIIPYDTDLMNYQARGEDVFSIGKANCAVAFVNIAKRLNGRNIPLFSGFRRTSRIPLIRKIQ